MTFRRDETLPIPNQSFPWFSSNINKEQYNMVYFVFHKCPCNIQSTIKRNY